MSTNYVKFNLDALKRIQKKSNPIWNKSFTVTFTPKNEVIWENSTLVAYYGDTLIVEADTVFCYRWDKPTETRWTNKATLHSNTAEWSYSNISISTFSGAKEVSNNETIEATCTKTKNTYTITWKYKTSYAGDLATATQVYEYGKLPTPTPTFSPPQIVTNSTDDRRYHFQLWDDTSMVTGDRTITAIYVQQGKFTANLTRCSLADTSLVSGGWYGCDSEFTVSVKADDNCAFEGTGATTTLTTKITVPKSITYSADYIYVNIEGIHCTASLSTGWHAYQTPCVWTPAEYYSFNAGTTQQTSAVSVVSPGGTYTNTPHYVRVKQLVTGNYSSGANINEYVYYQDTTQVQWKATSNYSYRGESTEDWSTDLLTIVPGGTMTAPNPDYVKCTITGDRATVSPSSGSIIKVGNNITWTATTNYSFAEGINRVATDTQAVKLDTLYYYNSADYKNVTINGTNCTANTLNGYRKLGSTITWTASTGTNYKYSFSSTNHELNQSTATITVDTAGYSKSALNLWYNVTSVTGTNCKAYTSSSFSTSFIPGWYLSGTQIYWQTTSTPYAMTSDNSTTQMVSAVAGNNDKSAVVKQYTFTLTKNSNVSSIKVWRNKSPYQNATITTESNPLIGNNSSTVIVYYGDELEGKATANTGYHFGAVNGANIANWGPKEITASTAWAPTVSKDTYTVTLDLSAFPADIVAEDNSWLSLSPTYNATSYPSGSTFNYGNTIYAIIKLPSLMSPIDITGSGWSQIQSGTYNYYVVGSVTATGSSFSLTITPKVVLNTYAATVSQGFGYNNVFLSTDPDAISGSPSGTKFPHGSTVYSFGILNVHASAVSGTLVRGTKNTPGAIYRIGSKVISANTNNNDLGTVTLSRDSMVVQFTGEGSTTGTVNFYLSSPMSASGYGSLSTSTSGNSITINCTTDNFNGDSTTGALMDINHGSQSSATCVLKNHAGNEIAWNAGYFFSSEGILIEVELTPSSSSQS